MNALSDAIYDRLTGSDPDAVALCAGLAAYKGAPAVFAGTYVPDDAPRPYVAIRPPMAADTADTKDRQGQALSVDIGVYDNNSGTDAPVADLAELIRGLLHKRPLAMSGWSALIADARPPIYAPTDNYVLGRIVQTRWTLRSWTGRDL